MKRTAEHEFVAFIGIDWADVKHDICLQVAHDDQREFSVVVHRPEAIQAWAQDLKRRFQGRPIAVCLELGLRTAGLCPAELRLPSPVPRESGNARQIPPGLHPQPCQG